MNKLGIVMGSIALLTATGATAEINFRGFGTVAAGHAFGTDEGQDIIGYEDSWDFRKGSLIALQMNADLEDKLSATAQFLSRGTNDFEVEMEWAYLSYEINDELRLNAGRMQAPFYRYSDYLDVHYAYNWLEAPDRVYNLRFPSFDGLSLLYNTSIGPIDSALQIIGGKLDSTFPESTSRFEYNSMMGFSWQGSWDWLTLRTSYLQADVSYASTDIDGIVAGFSSLSASMGDLSAGFTAESTRLSTIDNSFSNELAGFASQYSSFSSSYSEIADQVETKDDRGYFAGIGFSIDWRALIVESEAVKYEIKDGFSSKTTAYYLTIGARVGETIIYGTIEGQDSDGQAIELADIDIATLNANLTANQTTFSANNSDALLQTALGSNQVIAGTDTTLRSFLPPPIDTTNKSIGIRWDFHSSAALKAEYNIEDDKQNNLDGKLFRVAIDFVF